VCEKFDTIGIKLFKNGVVDDVEIFTLHNSKLGPEQSLDG